MLLDAVPAANMTELSFGGTSSLMCESHHGSTRLALLRRGRTPFFMLGCRTVKRETWALTSAACLPGNDIEGRVSFASRSWTRLDKVVCYSTWAQYRPLSQPCWRLCTPNPPWSLYFLLCVGHALQTIQAGGHLAPSLSLNSCSMPLH